MTTIAFSNRRDLRFYNIEVIYHQGPLFFVVWNVLKKMLTIKSWPISHFPYQQDLASSIEKTTNCNNKKANLEATTYILIDSSNTLTFKSHDLSLAHPHLQPGTWHLNWSGNLASLSQERKPHARVSKKVTCRILHCHTFKEISRKVFGLISKFNFKPFFNSKMQCCIWADCKIIFVYPWAKLFLIAIIYNLLFWGLRFEGIFFFFTFYLHMY